MKIGLSLSMCIRDILSGEVRLEDVMLIRSNTAARDQYDWERVFNSYSKTYWRQDPVRAGRILTLLLAANIIEQPRLTDPNYSHSITDGWWV